MKTNFFFFTTKIDLNKIKGNKTLWIFLIQKKIKKLFYFIFRDNIKKLITIDF